MFRRNTVLSLCSLALLTLLTAAPAGASIISADAYADETILNTVDAGVTLSAFSEAPSFGYPLTSLNIRAIAATDPAFGTRSYGVDSGDFRTGFFSGDHLFRADFTSFVGSVSILTGPDSSGDPDPVLIQIFDSANNLLDSVDTTPGVGLQTVSFLRTSNDVAYLIARNPLGQEGQSFSLDDLSFETLPESVPEPATLSLVLMGCAAAAVRRRRRA